MGGCGCRADWPRSGSGVCGDVRFKGYFRITPRNGCRRASQTHPLGVLCPIAASFTGGGPVPRQNEHRVSQECVTTSVSRGISGLPLEMDAATHPRHILRVCPIPGEVALERIRNVWRRPFPGVFPVYPSKWMPPHISDSSCGWAPRPRAK